MKGRKSLVRTRMLEYLQEHERASRKDLHDLRGNTTIKNADYHIRNLCKEGVIVSVIRTEQDGYKKEWYYLDDKRPGIPSDYFGYLINASETKDDEKRDRAQRELRNLLVAQGVDGEETLKLVLDGWKKAEAKGSENGRTWRKFMWNLAKNLRKKNSGLLTYMREEASSPLIKLGKNSKVQPDDRGEALLLLHLLESKNAELIAWKVMLDPDDPGFDENQTVVFLAVEYAQKDYYNRRRSLYDLLDEKAGRNPLVRRRILDLLDRLEHR